MSTPLSTELNNPHHHNFYTCPACYENLGAVGTGTHTCTDCGATVQCVFTWEPVCHSELVQQDQAQDQHQETAA